jgi:hypothetical protein
MAVYRGHFKLVKLLMNLGADKNIKGYPYVVTAATCRG